MRRWFLAVALLGATAGSAIELGQIDTFENGTTMFWQGAGQGPPINIPTDGPRGEDDNHLRVRSGVGIGPHLATYNPVHWSGDWTAAGVKAVEVHVRNESAVTLHLRGVWFSQTGARFTSTKELVIPPDGRWYKVGFPCRAGDLTRVLGGQSYAEAMTMVERFMLRHDPDPPSSGGTDVTGQLGVDNVEASIKIDLQPQSYDRIRGSETGGLSALFFSDDVRLTWKPGVTLVSSQAPVVFEADFNASTLTNPSAMQVDIEGSVTSISIRRQIEIWNAGAGAFEVLQSYTAGTTSDSTVSLPVADPTNYVNSNSGLIRTRISYKAFGPVLIYPWIARQDRIFVRLTP
jgi:hypothetical protein